MWELIDWLSGFMCRHGFHEWSEWKPNTFSGRISDWARDCERCNTSDYMNFGIGEKKLSPDGKPHPGSLY